MRGKDNSEVEFLGLRFAQMNEGEALEWLMDRAKAETYSYIVTPNVDHVVQLHSEPELLDHVYNEADLRLCDSRVIGLMARLNNMRLSVVTGSGLTARMLSRPLPPGLRIAMIGGNAHQREWLARTQPDAELLYHEPPFGLRTNVEAQNAAAAFVEAAQANIILITVGAPQSELIAKLIQSRGVARGVALCVGASLEFITGEKRRAPRWVQALALEWAFRLANEPHRLARRYLVDGPKIFSIWMDWRKNIGQPVQDGDGKAARGLWAVRAARKANAALNSVREDGNTEQAAKPVLVDPLIANQAATPQYKMAVATRPVSRKVR